MWRVARLLVATLVGWGLVGAKSRAEPRLLTPSSEQPAHVAPGALLALEVEVATGLTPPPGVQEDRAHRAFALALCASALDLGGGTRRCFALPVVNLRPRDATSLRYRIEAQLPSWLAPSRYDLVVRIPGKSEEVAGAVEVLRTPDDRLQQVPAARPEGAGWAWAAPSEPARARVHVGAEGLSLRGCTFEGFPQPDPEGGFEPGFVAMIHLAPGGRCFVTKRQAAARPALEIAPNQGVAGVPLRLRLAGSEPGSWVYWWFGKGKGAVGHTAAATFLYPGKQRVQALWVARDGRTARVAATLPIWQRTAFGCAVRPGRSAPGELGGCLGLLVVSGWWKLRGRRARWRRDAC